MANEISQPDEVEPAWLTKQRCDLMAKLAMRAAIMELNGINPMTGKPIVKPKAKRSPRSSRVSRVSHR